jgi:flavin reductase (DIM6/NTAB) family NADH-FMN oxidoreductase RutF
MLVIDPQNTRTADLHQYMLGAIAPRPIAFVSTVSADGIANLAPYSFFNAYSSRPPIVVFSSNRRVRDNTTKDTLANIAATGEVVINVVNYDMVYQMALASVEYEAGIDEFEKSGLTAIPADLVKPFRVKESPVQMECKVKQVIALGDEGGAGNLIICEIVRMHINPAILNENGKIDPYKIDLMARMGGAYYCRVVPEAIMTIAQPVEKIGIGVDALPDYIRLSNVLTGNDLARLATVTQIPLKQTPSDTFATRQQLEQYAQQLIQQEKIDMAWQVLLIENE